MFFSHIIDTLPPPQIFLERSNDLIHSEIAKRKLFTLVKYKYKKKMLFVVEKCPVEDGSDYLSLFGYSVW